MWLLFNLIVLHKIHVGLHSICSKNYFISIINAWVIKKRGKVGIKYWISKPKKIHFLLYKPNFTGNVSIKVLPSSIISDRVRGNPKWTINIKWKKPFILRIIYSGVTSNCESNSGIVTGSANALQSHLNNSSYRDT